MTPDLLLRVVVHRRGLLALITQEHRCLLLLDPNVDSFLGHVHLHPRYMPRCLEPEQHRVQLGILHVQFSSLTLQDIRIIILFQDHARWHLTGKIGRGVLWVVATHTQVGRTTFDRYRSTMIVHDSRAATPWVGPMAPVTPALHFVEGQGCQ